MNTSIIICQEPETSPHPPILVEKEVYCGECHSLHELEKCPLCGSWISFTYGMGNYAVCDSEMCNWVYDLAIQGCMGWYIQDNFISLEHYKESDKFPIRCEVHDCHAWECFNGDEYNEIKN